MIFDHQNENPSPPSKRKFLYFLTRAELLLQMELAWSSRNTSLVSETDSLKKKKKKVFNMTVAWVDLLSPRGPTSDLNRVCVAAFPWSSAPSYSKTELF